MTPQLLLYRGTSWISKAIQWQTRSPYSHAALLFPDGATLEAWHVGGVALNPDPFWVHAKGTRIDMYTIELDLDVDQMRTWAQRQVGKGYDFVSVLRFVTRRQAPHNSRWFCSELVEACVRAGLDGTDKGLLRGNPSVFSPRDLALSPHITYQEQL